MKYLPHNYQTFAEQHIYDNPFAGLFLDMGLGKTVTALTAAQNLIYDRMEVSGWLVIAPKRVAEETWPDELQKWDHLKGLSMVVISGTEKHRKAAIQQKADVHVIGRDNVAWLVAHLGGAWPWEGLIIDELSSFKDSASRRFRALKMVRPRCKRVIGLTGTPAPNSLMDLWAQMYLLDRGQRLGQSVTNFRQTYFNQNQYTHTYTLKKGDDNPDKYKDEIYGRISDICISMKAKDYLELPERVDIDVPVRFPESVMRAYRDFERDRVLEIADQEITAQNAMSLTGKLLQFASGAIYDTEHDWHPVHDEMLEALEEILEEANGEPVLLFYQYRHELDRIMERFKKFKPRHLQKRKDTDDWNAGKIKLFLAHPASAGHGLNLQYGGHIIVWFNLTYSLELYQQAIARLDRQGQEKPVRMYRLIAKGTMYERVAEVLDDKQTGQDALLKAVKAMVSKYQKIFLT